tara:strand:+ start:135 stop:308 length:174 start_codon:yes stop_codon:yes gene_type:complete
MELDMNGDPKKPCKICGEGADIKEGNIYYCCDHYSLYVLGKPMSQIEKELNGQDKIF